jgi:hypothetical protein
MTLRRIAPLAASLALVATAAAAANAARPAPGHRAADRSPHHAVVRPTAHSVDVLRRMVDSRALT